MSKKSVAAMTGLTEKQITNQILDAARCLGVELKRRNVGGFVNPNGQYVACGETGDSDRTGTIGSGPNRGKRLDVEIKHEHFDSARLRGKDREHFERQLAQLQRTNELGGVGFFCDDPMVFLQVMRIVLRGGRVELDEDGQMTVYEPRETPCG